MAYENEAILMYGWQVEQEKVDEFLAKAKEVPCPNFGYCNQGTCWCLNPERIGIPKDFTIVGCNPYDDARRDLAPFYLCASSLLRKKPTLAEILQVVDSVDWGLGRKFSILLGADDEDAHWDEPRLHTEPHVWKI